MRENGRALLQAVRLDDVDCSKAGGASFIGAAGAEEMRELEHERDEVDGDEEREKELDVLLDCGIVRFDLVERRLPGEEVAVRRDGRDPVCNLRGLGCLPGCDLALVGGDRCREPRVRALQRRRGRGGAAGVALAVGRSRPCASVSTCDAGFALGRNVFCATCRSRFASLRTAAISFCGIRVVDMRSRSCPVDAGRCRLLSWSLIDPL